MDVKMATIPKASGANSLVTIGVTRIPSTCAKTVPVMSFNMLPAKLSDGFVKEEIFTGKILGNLKSLKYTMPVNRHL